MQQAIIRRDWIDRVAIGLSGLCAVHCVASIVVVTLLASVGGFLLHPVIHEAGLAVATGLAALALGRGFFVHRLLAPALVGGLGIGVMAGALFVPHGGGEALCTIVGVILVAVGHGLNRRALA